MKYLPFILIIILSFALVQVQARTIKHLVDWGHYNSDSSPPSNQLNPNWMSRLPDDRPLSMISIPGTHDSGTYPANGNPLKGGDWTQCQSWDFKGQLEAGIRFLDIRFDYQGSSSVLGIYHSIFFMMNLQTAFKQIRRFLRNNPSEAVIILLAQENGKDIQRNPGVIQQHLKNSKLPYFYSTQIPTLGQARGKVWILKNTASFPESWRTFAFNNKQTNFDDKQTKYYLQNNWEADTDEKVKYAKQLIQRSCQPGKMKLNWLNIGKGGRWPYIVAKQEGGTNQSIQNFLKGRSGCVGILIMDFPGTNLIRLIINNNW